MTLQSCLTIYSRNIVRSGRCICTFLDYRLYLEGVGGGRTVKRDLFPEALIAVAAGQTSLIPNMTASHVLPHTSSDICRTLNTMITDGGRERGAEVEGIREIKEDRRNKTVVKISGVLQFTLSSLFNELVEEEEEWT